MILLDTCALLWLAADQSPLSPKAVGAIRASGEFAEISAISAWEIAWKQFQGHLELGRSAQEWFQLALQTHQLREAPVTAAIALRSAELPRLHRDPADRFIIATALELSLPVITPDRLIQQYPGIKTIW